MTLIRREAWRPQGVADLEPRAWEALRETDRSVLVTAGAGAGKTEFLAQKATYLLQTGRCAAPKRILAISFKRDAARNLSQRVEKRCPSEQARRFDSMTFDAFTKNLLDRFRAAIPADFSPPANYRIVFPHSRDYGDFLEHYGIHGINARQLEAAIATTRLPLPKDGPRVRILATYWHSQYNEHEEVFLSFLMINRLIEWLLRENPAIQRALQLTYPFVFLDEYQDTTSPQFEVLQTAFAGSNAVFTAVGDDKQRIMLWAGAMPDAFPRFEAEYGARRIPLLSNWRSHDDLVRIQHVIARRIDPTAEYPHARANREVAGDIAAIWEFATNEEERAGIANWISNEVQLGHVRPHEIAILIRQGADNIEAELVPAFSAINLRLRNVARMVGEISIQDLLGEDFTSLLLPLLRLGAVSRSPEHWNAVQRVMQFVEAVDFLDDAAQEQLQFRLQRFVRELRQSMRELEPDEDSARRLVRQVLGFVGVSRVRRTFVAYQRQQDFDRVWQGFEILLTECAERAATWQEVLDEFEGFGQIALMTIHKSKGLEFHTMIFYGLDNQTWWSLKPNNIEELNSFFVAFTRAKQRAFFTLCRERGRPVAWIEDLLAPAGVHRVNGAVLVGD